MSQNFICVLRKPPTSQALVQTHMAHVQTGSRAPSLDLNSAVECQQHEQAPCHCLAWATHTL